MSTERDEMREDEERKAMARAEALSEAMRVLPMARGWMAIAVMPDGNPAVMMHLPQYADAVCIQHVSDAVIKDYIATSFQRGPTQQL